MVCGTTLYTVGYGSSCIRFRLCRFHGGISARRVHNANACSLMVSDLTSSRVRLQIVLRNSACRAAAACRTRRTFSGWVGALCVFSDNFALPRCSISQRSCVPRPVRFRCVGCFAGRTNRHLRFCRCFCLYCVSAPPIVQVDRLAAFSIDVNVQMTAAFRRRPVTSRHRCWRACWGNDHAQVNTASLAFWALERGSCWNATTSPGTPPACFCVLFATGDKLLPCAPSRMEQNQTPPGTWQVAGTTFGRPHRDVTSPAGELHGVSFPCEQEYLVRGMPSTLTGHRRQALSTTPLEDAVPPLPCCHLIYPAAGHRHSRSTRGAGEIRAPPVSEHSTRKTCYPSPPTPFSPTGMCGYRCRSVPV